MAKRTTIYLDANLLAEAAAILGTSGNTETIHAALQAAVRGARLRRLSERDFSALDPAALAELRRVDVVDADAAREATTV
jgi:Arc/MetJ family transcription regulator